MKSNKWLSLLLLGFSIFLIMVNSFAVKSQKPPVKPNNIIAFMTDYGNKDFYVGAVKGVILSITPTAKIVDITHEITPFNIQEGALTLLLAAREFPMGTVFVAVVDPGVGTVRHPILLVTKDGKYFIGPDNGLLSMVMNELGVDKVYEIKNPNWFRKKNISHTFHGKDIFGPAAAHLVKGDDITTIGPTITDYVKLPFQTATLSGNKIKGNVIFIDTYGNIQVNITASLLEKANLRKGDLLHVRIGDKDESFKFLSTYGDVPSGDLLALMASTEFLEIAINLGNAADRLKAKLGDPVIIEK
jgi:S-adenosylmethionine hydrolase